MHSRLVKNQKDMRLVEVGVVRRTNAQEVASIASFLHSLSTHDQTDRKPLSDPLAASDGQHLQRYLRPRQTKALITAFHANRRRSR